MMKLEHKTTVTQHCTSAREIYKGESYSYFMTNQNSQLIVFQDKKIRRIWHNNEWYFSVVDVVGVLTESGDPKDYWYRLKKREAESAGIELSTICRQLKIIFLNLKKRKSKLFPIQLCEQSFY